MPSFPRKVRESRILGSSIDPVKVKSGKPHVYLFNILRNEYRLICAVHFNTGKVFTLRFMKHTEYEKGAWKNEL
jgi:mRNA-degrading endonuclease HigB of HigAB toxin-antitoxin module